MSKTNAYRHVRIVEHSTNDYRVVLDGHELARYTTRGRAVSYARGAEQVMHALTRAKSKGNEDA